MERTLQSLFKHSFGEYAKQNKLPLRLHKAAWSIQQCRTATLGGHIQKCPHGHVEGVWYNSCKHRSCPQWNALATEHWLEKQKARLIDGAHFHVVFTLPHELNLLWRYNRVVLEQGLFAVVALTLKKLTTDPKWLGATPGFILAFHSWGRSLSFHPHIHCLITDGGLDDQGHWQLPNKPFLFPVNIVKTLFRRRLLIYLQKLHSQQQLALPDALSHQQLSNLLNKLGRKKWHVTILERYPHGEGVLIYLSRYVRGGPLKHLQIQSIDTTHIRYHYYCHKEKRMPVLLGGF